MKKIWMLLLTLTVSTFFIHVPHEGQIGFILNPEIKLSYNQYFWMICQHLITLTLAAIIWDESTEYKVIVGWYVVLEIADLVLWVLSYTDPLRSYRITWNILKTVIFIGIIVWQLKRRR